MTDDELGAKLANAWHETRGRTLAHQNTVLGQRARELLSARPEVTREAVSKWYWDGVNGNADWTGGNFHIERVILAALSHFAPPAAPLPPICGMSEAQIEEEMYIRMETKRKAMEGVIYVQECARVAHHLAQPAPVVDPDAGVMKLFWQFMQGHGGFLPGTTESHWIELTEEERNGWRAVAKEKANG